VQRRLHLLIPYLFKKSIKQWLRLESYEPNNFEGSKEKNYAETWIVEQSAVHMLIQISYLKIYMHAYTAIIVHMKIHKCYTRLLWDIISILPILIFMVIDKDKSSHLISLGLVSA